MVKGKRVISENVRMMVLLQDIWHQKGHQDALVILVINLYKQIQNKLLQKILELKSRNEENKNATDGGFSAADATNVLCQLLQAIHNYSFIIACMHCSFFHE